MRLTFLFLICWVCTVVAQPAETTIEPDMLDELIRIELSGRYDPGLAREYRALHSLLEGFINRPSERAAILRQLQERQADAVVSAALLRVRSTWTEMRPGTHVIDERVGPMRVWYVLGIPEGYTAGKRWPTVVKMPPPEGVINILRLPSDEQVATAYSGWVSQELARGRGTVVVMPVLAIESLVGAGYVNLHPLRLALQHAADHVNVDPQRVYVYGESLVSAAAWNLLLHYPTYFAGGQFMAGQASAEWQRVRLPMLLNGAVVMWHDTADRVVDIRQSRTIAGILRRLQYDVTLQETRSAGHRVSNDVRDPAWAVLREKTRELYPARVIVQSNRPETMFNRVDWIQANAPVRGGEERRLLVARGREVVNLYGNPMRLEASIVGPNAIDIRATNVDTARLYLSADMIDFDKPISITWNRRTTEIQVKPDLQTMLRDQLLLGRGWRHYVAVIDLPL